MMRRQQFSSCGDKVSAEVQEPIVSVELSAARTLLESVEWTCFGGKPHTIYPCDHGVWQCVREGCDGWDSVLLWYDAHSKMVWWNKEKEYCFDPIHPANKPGKINWYSIGDVRTNPKAHFTWYNAELLAKRCAEVTEPEPPHDHAGVCDTTAPRLAVLNVRPPPGLELPLPPGLEDLLPPGLPCKLHEFDTDDRSMYDEETSAGCTTPHSERSEETSTDSACDSPSLFNADAPHFVPILAPAAIASKHDASQRLASQRTPLKAGAALFQPKPALPFLPTADVAQAWTRQDYVQPAAARSRPRARTAKKFPNKPLQPGLQCPGTLEQARLRGQ